MTGSLPLSRLWLLIMLAKFMAVLLSAVIVRACSPETRTNHGIVRLVWFSPGVPLARKAINAFIYSKHDALRSMEQGSCVMRH